MERILLLGLIGAIFTVASAIPKNERSIFKATFYDKFDPRRHDSIKSKEGAIKVNAVCERRWIELKDILCPDSCAEVLHLWDEKRVTDCMKGWMADSNKKKFMNECDAKCQRVVTHECERNWGELKKPLCDDCCDETRRDLWESKKVIKCMWGWMNDPRKKAFMDKCDKNCKNSSNEAVSQNVPNGIEGAAKLKAACEKRWEELKDILCVDSCAEVLHIWDNKRVKDCMKGWMTDGKKKAFMDSCDAKCQKEVTTECKENWEELKDDLCADSCDEKDRQLWEGPKVVKCMWGWMNNEPMKDFMDECDTKCSKKGAIALKAECEKNWKDLKDILCVDACAETLYLWDEERVKGCMWGWMADRQKKAFMNSCDAKCKKEVTSECRENWEELKNALCADCCHETNRELWEGPTVKNCMWGWMNNAPMKPFMDECDKKCSKKGAMVIKADCEKNWNELKDILCVDACAETLHLWEEKEVKDCMWGWMMDATKKAFMDKCDEKCKKVVTPECEKNWGELKDALCGDCCDEKDRQLWEGQKVMKCMWGWMNDATKKHFMHKCDKKCRKPSNEVVSQLVGNDKEGPMKLKADCEKNWEDLKDILCVDACAETLHLWDENRVKGCMWGWMTNDKKKAFMDKCDAKCKKEVTQDCEKNWRHLKKDLCADCCDEKDRQLWEGQKVNKCMWGWMNEAPKKDFMDECDKKCSKRGAMVLKAECEKTWEELKDILCADACAEVLHLWDDKKVKDCMKGWMTDGKKKAFMDSCDAKCPKVVSDECDENWKELKDSLCADCCNEKDRQLWEGPKVMECMWGWMNDGSKKNFMNECDEKCSKKGAMELKADCEKTWKELKDILCVDACAETLHLWDEKKVTDCMKGWMIDGTKKAFMDTCDAKCEKEVSSECKANWEELKDALCADCCHENNRKLWESQMVMKCMWSWMNNEPMKPFMDECDKKCRRSSNEVVLQMIRKDRENRIEGAMVLKAACEKTWEELKDILCLDCCAETLHLWDEKKVTDCMWGWKSDGNKKAFMDSCDAKCKKEVTPECEENWGELKTPLCADCCDEKRRDLWESKKVMKCMWGWMNDAPKKTFMDKCDEKCKNYVGSKNVWKGAIGHDAGIIL